MKLNPNSYPYEFSIDENEKIDYVFLYDRKNAKKDIEDFIQNLIDNSDLVIGDGCDGEIMIYEKNIVIDYRWISSLGLDWLGRENKERLLFHNE